MSDFNATHMHLNSRDMYEVMADGFMERDMSNVVIYRNEDNVYFVRPSSEFYDGRFTEMRDF